MTTTTYYNRFMIVAVLTAVLSASGRAQADVMYVDSNAYFNMAGSAPWELTGDRKNGIYTVSGMFHQAENVASGEKTWLHMYSNQIQTSTYAYDGNSVAFTRDPNPNLYSYGVYGWGLDLSMAQGLDSFYLQGSAVQGNKFSSFPAGSHVTLVATDSYGIEHVMHQLI